MHRARWLLPGRNRRQAVTRCDLDRQGFSEPIRPQDVKNHHPLLWTARSAMPRHGIAVLADGTVQVLTDAERDDLLARTVDELTAARNSP